MSSIVQFPMDRVPAHGRRQGNAVAEIIIFPGVRIERSKTDSATRSGIGRKRRSSQVAIDQDID